MASSDIWTIICSPVSGKRQGRRFVEEHLIPALKAKGINHVVHFTEFYQHAKQLAKGQSKIICVGGDGTANEVLDSCPMGATVSIVSEGTMNFFGVCADLPSDAKQIAELISRGASRPCSVMKVNTKGGPGYDAISFEGLHIGKMPYNVCKGASNADPKNSKQRGTLKFWGEGGAPIATITDDFFWIIMTYRNPYNGVVGNDLWLSWMTLDQFPGFERMMKFFEPQMEHFQGTSRCFGCHAKVVRAEFTLDDTVDGGGGVALVIEGDARECGRTVTVDHCYGAFQVVADEEPPKMVNTQRIAVGGGALTPKPLTPAAKKWLTMYPPPTGVAFPAPLEVPPPKEGMSDKAKIVAGVLFILLVMWVRRHPPT